MRDYWRSLVIWALGYEPAPKVEPYTGNESAALDQLAKSLKTP